MASEGSVSLQNNIQRQSLELEEPSNVRKSVSSQLKRTLSNLTVEPVAVCTVLNEMMLIITWRNWQLEKTCRVNLALEEEICDALTARNESYPNYTMNVETVQKYSSSMLIWNNVISSFLPVVLLLLAGAWSDEHKRRKICLLIPTIGETVTTLIYLLGTYFFYELPLEVGIVADAVTALTGGWTVRFMAMHTYLSGITSTKTRTVRIGILNLIVHGSSTSGTALGGILYNITGFYGVFFLCLVLYLLAIAYTIVFLRDIRDIEIEKGIYKKFEGQKNVVLDFFDFGNIKRTLSACFKKGPNNRRARVCSIVALAMIHVGPVYGELNISYFFARYKYGWDSADASYFAIFVFVVASLGTLFALAVFTKYLNLDDAILGIISNSSRIVGRIIMAIAPTPFWYYVGSIALKSYLSKFVPPEELGQANSLVGVTEAVTLLVYGPLYSRIYVATIDVFPGAFYIASAILTVPGVLLFLFLYFENRKDQRNDKLQRQQDVKLLQTLEDVADHN